MFKFNGLFILLILFFGCSQNDSLKDNATITEDVKTPFEAFSFFPDYQYKTLKLDQNQTEVIERISSMQTNQLVNQEVIHFYFPSDSTELILPNQTTLTEFKVYLQSNHYLKNENELRNLFANYADQVKTNNTMYVYYYSNSAYNFRLTYFLQNKTIRLHFLTLNKQS